MSESDPKFAHLAHVPTVARVDAVVLEHTDREYGASWKKRDGVGAYMMLARKWDRLEERVRDAGYDVFAAASTDTRAEGTIDDIRDLRRYLTLVEAELLARGTCPPLTVRDQQALHQEGVPLPEIYRAALVPPPARPTEPWDTARGDPPEGVTDRRVERLRHVLDGYWMSENLREHPLLLGKARMYNASFSHPLSEEYLERLVHDFYLEYAGGAALR